MSALLDRLHAITPTEGALIAFALVCLFLWATQSE